MSALVDGVALEQIFLQVNYWIVVASCFLIFHLFQKTRVQNWLHTSILTNWISQFPVLTEVRIHVLAFCLGCGNGRRTFFRLIGVLKLYVSYVLSVVNHFIAAVFLVIEWECLSR